MKRRQDEAAARIQRTYKLKFKVRVVTKLTCQKKIEIMERHFKRLRLKLYEDSQIKIAYHWRKWRKKKLINLAKTKKNKERKKYGAKFAWSVYQPEYESIILSSNEIKSKTKQAIDNYKKKVPSAVLSGEIELNVNKIKETISKVVSFEEL